MPVRRIFAFILLLTILAGSGFASGQTSQSPSPAPSTEPIYQIEAEDIITLTVLRHPEFSGDFLVPQAGIVQFPAVGPVHVGGMTLAQVAQTVTASLAENRLWKPEVTATLKLARVRRVYVVGDVKVSGAYDWKPGWTVPQLLSAAGGLNPEIQPNDVQVVLQHPNGDPAVTLPLLTALQPTSDPKLEVKPGDTLRVESVLTLPVFVSGHVLKPGMYRIRYDSANALSAISEAGGTLPDASLIVRIQHAGGTQDTLDLTPAFVEGKKIPLAPLQSGDMIIVAESQRHFVVLGYVSKPGSYPIPDGHTYHLADALAAAADSPGPATTADKRGRITRIALLRTVNGKPLRKIYDLSKFLKNGDETQNPLVESGDTIFVPQSNGIEITTWLAGLGTFATLYYFLK